MNPDMLDIQKQPDFNDIDIDKEIFHLTFLKRTIRIDPQKAGF